MIRVKICGVTTVADAVHAADCGADALGLNFYEKSPRYLSAALARAIVWELPPFVAPVGVFVETGVIDTLQRATDLGLRAAQIYRNDFDELPARYHPAFIPSFRVRDEIDLIEIRTFLRGCRPHAILIDSFVPGAMGGTGHRAPWDLLAGFDPGVPIILAGGLTPDNVAAAIERVRPWGVDVASGVESSPGVKDAGKVRAFVKAAKGAGAVRA